MICKEIITKHAGRIWVESQPGKGSSFQFTISDYNNRVFKQMRPVPKTLPIIGSAPNRQQANQQAHRQTLSGISTESYFCYFRN